MKKASVRRSVVFVSLVAAASFLGPGGPNALPAVAAGTNFTYLPDSATMSTPVLASGYMVGRPVALRMCCERSRSRPSLQPQARWSGPSQPAT